MNSRYRDLAARVRHHGEVARLEVPRDDSTRLLAAKGLPERLRKTGFLWVAMDLEAFRSGGVNRALEQAEKTHGR